MAMIRPMLRRLATLVALLATLLLAGCGDDETTTETAAAPAATTDTAPEAATPTAGAPQPVESKDITKKPVIAKPTGEPPTGLQTADIVKGKGKAAKAGDTVSVQYVGVSYSTGEEFDASWDRGEPFQFQLGAGNVIQGWDQGVAGMKVGGRRKLTIPPDLGYGAAGSPPAIAPNETLIFIVDLLEIS